MFILYIVHIELCFLTCVQKLAKTEHLLWQLYTIEKDAEKIEAELEEDRRSLQQVLEENQSSDYELSAKKKEQSGFLKKMTLCEKSIAKKKLELDKKVKYLPVYFSLHQTLLVAVQSWAYPKKMASIVSLLNTNLWHDNRTSFHVVSRFYVAITSLAIFSHFILPGTPLESLHVHITL